MYITFHVINIPTKRCVMSIKRTAKLAATAGVEMS